MNRKPYTLWYLALIAVRTLIIVWASAGCSTFMGGQNADKYPAEIKAQCESANAWGKADIARRIGHEPRRTCGWQVRIVEGADSPYGKAIRCDMSPTGWAAATTEGNQTLIVRSRINDANLQHEARHYWAHTNGVEVGL